MPWPAAVSLSSKLNLDMIYFLLSVCISFTRLTQTRISMNRYGNAITVEIVWMTDIPPEMISANATTAIKSPQKIFLSSGGSSAPSDVSIDSTKVAESADVMY